MKAYPAMGFPFQEYAARIKRFERLRKKMKLQAVLIFSEVNLHYFTGLTCDNGALILQAGEEPTFYTDFRYLVMAERCAPGLHVEPIWPRSGFEAFFAASGLDWRRVGYEGSIPASLYRALETALPAVEWIDVSGALMDMRSIKSPRELRAMRLAVAQNDAMFADLMQAIQPGMTEWEIRNVTRRLCDEYGQGEAFSTIACVGKNAAECHHEPDETVWRKNTPLLLDLGVKVNHYCSDMTRCVVCGRVSDTYRKVFELVDRANRTAIQAIRPGLPCSEIDAVARNVLEKAGYGKAFGHSLGHSVGLEIHENPGFSPGCGTLLKPGMVITVEPGIYLPGRLGVRIEDMILVTNEGCEILTRTPHEIRG